MAQTYIVDKDGNQIDASTATVPADRHFRGAWSLSGSVITEDMDAAKTIFKDKIREVRGPLLEAEDGIRDLVRSRGLGDVYKRQTMHHESDGQKERLLMRHQSDSRPCLRCMLLPLGFSLLGC